VWYLVAAVEGDMRSYRVSRIADASVMDEPCVRPEGFDLADYWEKSTKDFKANLPRYQAKVRAAPEIIPRLYFAGRFARIESISQPDEEGWSEVSIRFDVEEMACEYALSFGSRMEVIEPAELREKVLIMAESLIEFYARKLRRPSDADKPASSNSQKAG
jgi:predicted DNA-binding transcriptional regulator YafY